MAQRKLPGDVNAAGFRRTQTYPLIKRALTAESSHWGIAGRAGAPVCPFLDMPRLRGPQNNEAAN